MIWVKVDRAAALAHPKGTLGPALWAVVVFFVARAAWFAIVANAAGGGWIEWAQIGLMLALVATLVLRMPLAFPLMITEGVVVVFSFVARLEGAADLVPLADIAIHVAILGYMFEGLRPNLIYRYRFRAYRPVEDADAE